MKEGYKTTEFWATIAMGILAQFGPVAEAAGPKTTLVVQAALAAAYAMSRGVSKLGTGPAGGAAAK